MRVMNIDRNCPALRGNAPTANRRRVERRSALKGLDSQAGNSEGANPTRGERRKERRLSRIETGGARERRRQVTEPRFAALVLGQILPEDRSNWIAANRAYAKGQSISKAASLAGRA